MPHTTNDENILYYSLGQRDAVASVLAEQKDKIKLPELAIFYKQHYEEHFSHKWHTS